MEFEGDAPQVARSRNRLFEELPHWVDDRACVRIGMKAHHGHATGDVDFDDVIQVQVLQVGSRVEPVIHRICVEVVQVEEHGATGPMAEFVEKSFFSELLAGVTEIADIILEQERTAGSVGEKPDARHQQVERFLVVRDWYRQRRVHLVPGTNAQNERCSLIQGASRRSAHSIRCSAYSSSKISALQIDGPMP